VIRTDATLPTRPAPVDDAERLKTSVRQLEGVFVQQLFKAMRDTVPTEGMFSGGAGEEMFTGLLDEHMAELVPAQWNSPLGAALLQQLQRNLAPAAAPQADGAGA